MASYPLIVAQYNLEGHPRRTEHWSLAALLDVDRAHIFELAGNSSTYQYSSQIDNRFGRSQRLRGGCHVGSIAADKVDWLENRLRDVTVVYGDEEFDCQTWVLEALRLISNDNGVELRVISEKLIREELIREIERWESGEDTVEDRLFHSIRT
ncbi:hypothetical protein FPV67DRAFT_1450842 [Lyophyllum atratum]|nr:hypothetical protein FPV67DRAFT_1450842 [Lyophyllum atratum]